MAKAEYNAARVVIEKFGGQTALAALLGKRQSTVHHWAKTGLIPTKWHGKLIEAATLQGVLLRSDEFISTMPAVTEAPDPVEVPEPTSDEPLPPDSVVREARWSGVLSIGDIDVKCYVLDNGMRLLTQRGAILAIAGKETGAAADYWGIDALKPYLNGELVAAQTVVFSIPGLPGTARGIGAETFIDICKAYVSALKDGQLPTKRQAEIAVGCSLFLGACAKVGLLALIDEATGYQFERAEDALQVKLKLYLEEEMRKWDRTFPEDLWKEFGRLTKWKGSIHSRPKYWATWSWS